MWCTGPSGSKPQVKFCWLASSHSPWGYVGPVGRVSTGCELHPEAMLFLGTAFSLRDRATCFTKSQMASMLIASAKHFTAPWCLLRLQGSDPGYPEYQGFCPYTTQLRQQSLDGVACGTRGVRSEQVCSPSPGLRVSDIPH